MIACGCGSGEATMANDLQRDATIYSPVARRFHWWTAALVLFMIPLGFIMTDDSNPFKISETTGARRGT